MIPKEEDLHRQILIAKGVPPQAIEIFGEGSLSTIEEAQLLAKRFNTSARLLVVTSPTHVLRARLVISAALRGRNVTVQVVPTPYDAIETRWWRNQATARSVILEVAKLVFYVLGGSFFSNGIGAATSTSLTSESR
jgi:uncharacterized SAM-binding protein YcdF (DUF218 family)